MVKLINKYSILNIILSTIEAVLRLLIDVINTKYGLSRHNCQTANIERREPPRRFPIALIIR